jgi:hypothetical protein
MKPMATSTWCSSWPWILITWWCTWPSSSAGCHGNALAMRWQCVGINSSKHLVQLMAVDPDHLVVHLAELERWLPR